MTPKFLAGPDDGRLDYYEEIGVDMIVLEEDFVFRDSRGLIWIAPAGLEYDGASIPRLVWSIVGHPLQARHILAGALHDNAYQTGFRLTVDPEVLVLELARRALGSIDEMTCAEVCALPRTEALIDSRGEVDRFAFFEPLLVTPTKEGKPANTWLHSRVLYRAVSIGAGVAWSGHIRRRARERVPFSRLAA